MEDRLFDLPDSVPDASGKASARKTWRTPSLTIVEVGGVTLGSDSYTSDGLDGS